MAVLIGRNTKVEVEKTLGAPITIQAIENSTGAIASPTGLQVRANAHGFLAGAIVIFTVEGMTQLDGQIARVINPLTNSFDIEGVDTTDYATFTSGTVNEVTAWDTLGVARTVSAGSVSANRLDATTLIDTERQYVLGMPDVPEITIEMLSAPFNDAVEHLESAGRSSANLGFRITMSDGGIRLFRGQVTIPSENIAVNELVTGQISVTQTKRRLAYES